MNRSHRNMVSSRGLIALMATLHFLAFTDAGPLPVQNVTNSDMGLKEGSCALGDVVYMSGDEFPGSSPCERCQCAAGGVRCAQQQCDPRPGCKALHRPDHCCPTYQCECEQQGRVYGNGEKLVDPLDPCRVCYCQGGEVVCRRIACFVRDDCKPRLVPGRCCPEYDNCPLRGVTALPSSLPTIVAASPDSAPHDDKPKFSIKEITPVSEIPVITDVKIKEILPSPSVDAAEYSSSKSPLIPREATSEKSNNADHETQKSETEVPSVVAHSNPDIVSTQESKATSNSIDTPAPSKISFSTQDSINSEIYPSPIVQGILATLGVPVNTPDSSPVSITTKAPIVEEEDPSLFDHNPAFPPLPDDLSVLSNHGDEIVPEPSADSDHIPVENTPAPEVIVASVATPTTAVSNEPLTTTFKYVPDAFVFTTERSPEHSTELSSTLIEITSTSAPTIRENPTIKLRSAIPSEVFRATSEEASATEHKTTTTESTLDTTTQTSTAIPLSTIESTNTVTESSKKSAETIIEESSKSTEITKSEEISKSSEINRSQETSKPFETTSAEPELLSERVSFITTGKPEPKPEVLSTTQKEMLTTTHLPIEFSTTEESSSTHQEPITNSIAKSNIATERTFQTELSSLPIETSDQKPHESSSENVSKDTMDISTTDPFSDNTTTTTEKSVPSFEAVTIAKADSRSIENVETTEFILNPFGSSESSTDAVELIKIPGDSDKNEAIIDGGDGNKNAFTDLIKLVSDVASMSEHTDVPPSAHRVGSTSYSESEELIPVNAGYKSKNSNFNQNSITEVPFKIKSVPNKQKVVEIEDDEEGGIADSQVPDDKAEPTTRRPLIDHVSDTMTDSRTDRKDIEIITQSYVPTINRRPTKVVLGNNRSELSEELPQDDAPAASQEVATESAAPDSSESVTGSSLELGGDAASTTEQ